MPYPRGRWTGPLRISAWYQTDLQANSSGQIFATLRTILINRIFAFHPAAALAPTDTFHVGFWFNNPADAQRCGFNPLITYAILPESRLGRRRSL